MKKVLFTSILLLSAVSFGGNVYAQDVAGGDNTEATTPSESSASVDFKASEGDKTLTISGQGDLTTLKTISQSLKFTTSGTKNVGTSNNIYNISPVGTSAVYSAAKTYYGRYPKKLISLYPDYVDAAVTYSWNEDKLESLYHYAQDDTDKQWKWLKVTSTDKIDPGVSWVDDKQYSNYATSADGSGRILLTDFKSGGYYNENLSDVTFKTNKLNNLYVVANGKYAALATDATYNASETYYAWDPTFVDASIVNFGQISEDEMIKLGYLDHPEETVADQISYMLSNNNTYTDIKFVNEDATQALKIDNAIVKAILYPGSSTNSKSNDVLTNLDLSAATCVDFSKETFAQGYASGYPVIETLALPLSESGITPEGVVLNLQGEYHKLTKVVIPEGYTKVGDQTFCLLNENNGASTKLTEVVLPSTLEEIGESAFRNCSGLKSIKLNDNLKTIGKFAFAGTGLTSLTLPKNLDKVCDGAFWNLKQLYVIELNENLRYIGNGAFGCDGDLVDKCKTQTTIKIPASVKYIGAYAFSERKYQDVYFLGKVAPVCPEGTFEDGQNKRHEGTAFTSTDDKVHFGNSGFSTSGKNSPLADDVSQGYANRENYINGGFYFTILHYPSDATDVDTYTDTTRKYLCRVQDDGKINTEKTTVGQETLGDIDYWDAQNVQTAVDPGYADTYVGTQYVWPSHAQFTRAYATAAKGVKWDGVTPYAPKLSEDVLAVLKEAGYNVTDEKLPQKAYIGTRKFAIANGDGKSLPSYRFKVTKGEWWTICVPFNMTKKQVLDAFGADTKLCLFTSVVRQIDIDNKNHILLNFTQSALKSSTTDENGKKLQKTPGHWDYEAIAASEAPDDNDIVLWAHESYMIKPDGGACSDKEPTYIMDSYEPVEGNPLPTIVNATTKTLGQADDSTAEYRFIGNYLGNAETRAASVKIPQYSYVYATTKSDPVCKFRFYTGTTSNWKPNKSIVQTNNRGGGAADYKNFFGGEPGILPAGAKQSSIFGDEDFGAVTGIDDVTIVVGSEALTPIFNLEGKIVRTNGNVEGLPKGVYVKAGKKFIIK